ncbi:hypothetical protein [Nocardia sp. NPDC002869]|uniref:hypothetical protein n=1 Tax=Nocardia sp. NPDC002869 TaxID=3161032 RepID=UPI00398C960E
MDATTGTPVSEVAGVYAEAVEGAAHGRTFTVGVPDRLAGAGGSCVEQAAASC